MKKITILILLLSISAFSFFAGSVLGEKKQAKAIESRIYRQAEVKTSGGDWGTIDIYTDDQTLTYGTKNMLTAVLEFLPGKQLHPAHQHSEEEFAYVIEGNGTWSLNGVESPIKPGDLLYAKPMDMHGIDNTGETPLKFFVVKWNTRNLNKQ